MVVDHDQSGRTLLDVSLPAALSDAPAARMMGQDMQIYLPNDTLYKVEGAAMAIILEAHVPIREPEALAAAVRLSTRMKIHNGRGKWALRQILDQHVSRASIETPKSGFGVSMSAWLRGPLGCGTEDYLRRNCLFDPDPVRHACSRHLSRRRDWTHRLWSVLMAWSADFA